jgi:Tfp pilus assembly protein PilF
MLSQHDSQQSERRLNSWKSIAAYFERDERTVKRWEAQRGLPIHRVPGAGRSSVYAYTHELAEWLKTADCQNDPVAQPLTSEVSEHLEVFKKAEIAGAMELEPAPTAATASRRTGQILVTLLIVSAAVFSVASFAAYRNYFNSPSTLASSKPGGPKHSANPEAEELYLQGLYHWNKRTPESLNLALDDFTQSIVRDPNYAPAYVGLANCYNLLREYTLMPAKDAYPRAIAAAKRAIALDDSLPEAHNALAFGDFYWNWDSAGAEHEFQRAIALDPNSVVTHHWYATFLAVEGRTEQALDEIEKARVLDPQSSSILADKGLILFDGGQAARSLALLKRIEATDPSFLSPHTYLAIADLRTRDYPEYLQELRKSAQLLKDDNRLRIAAAAEKGFRASGSDGMLRAMVEVQKELYAKNQFSAFELAATYSLLGEKQEALDLLAVSVKNREEQAIALRSDLAFVPLHNEAAYGRLLAQVGLPPLN